MHHQVGRLLGLYLVSPRKWLGLLGECPYP